MLQAPFGLVLRDLLAIVVGDSRIAVRLEAGIAQLVDRGLGQIRGGGGEFRARALDRQGEVLRIEPCHHVADPHEVAHIDVAGDDLAGHPEAEIGFVARPHHADEFADRILPLERHPAHLHRPFAGSGPARLLRRRSHRARALLPAEHAPAPTALSREIDVFMAGSSQICDE